jgi:hypothetical protein
LFGGMYWGVFRCYWCMGTSAIGGRCCCFHGAAP